MIYKFKYFLEDETKPKILSAQRNSLFIMPVVNTIGKNDFRLKALPSNVTDIKALVYNPINSTVILSGGGKILEYDLKSGKLTVLVEDGILNVVAIEIGT